MSLWAGEWCRLWRGALSVLWWSIRVTDQPRELGPAAPLIATVRLIGRGRPGARLAAPLEPRLPHSPGTRQKWRDTTADAIEAASD